MRDLESFHVVSSSSASSNISYSIIPITSHVKGHFRNQRHDRSSAEENPFGLSGASKIRRKVVKVERVTGTRPGSGAETLGASYSMPSAKRIAVSTASSFSALSVVICSRRLALAMVRIVSRFTTHGS